MSLKPVYLKGERVTCSEGHTVGYVAKDLYVGDSITELTVVDSSEIPVFKDGDPFSCVCGAICFEQGVGNFYVDGKLRKI